MKSPHIVALHGFLGHPHDFKVLNLENVIAPNIFNTPMTSLWSWSMRFSCTMTDNSILLGYSMGGRLALHCLLKSPERYKAAIIVAAHPGLDDEKLKYARRLNDDMWSKKFMTMPWEELMEEWNNAPALKGSVAIPRLERDYDRCALSHAMRYFSLGRQDYLIPKLSEISVPILWLMREAEATNSRGLTLRHPLSRIERVQGSHRFLFENPEHCQKQIKKFIKSVI